MKRDDIPKEVWDIGCGVWPALLIFLFLAWGLSQMGGG